MIDSECSKIQLRLGEDSFDISVGRSYVDMFEGKRVIYTKSKNNDLQWIEDWAKFYQVTHGVNGVLLYDNGSTQYSCHEILDVLSRVPGIEAAAVVSWPFKFGPQAGASGRFDSDFFEYVVSSNAQHRFLSRASSVTHCDIDELVLTADGRPIHEHLEESEFGYLRYFGRVITGHLRVPVGDGETLSFGNFGYYSPEKKLSTLKWSCMPNRLAPDVQWRTHAIDGLSVRASSQVLHRHFHAVSTGWKFTRVHAPGAAPADLQVDEQLVASMEAAEIAQNPSVEE